jgi:hypothetical protein
LGHSQIPLTELQLFEAKDRRNAPQVSRDTVRKSGVSQDFRHRYQGRRQALIFSHVNLPRCDDVDILAEMWSARMRGIFSSQRAKPAKGHPSVIQSNHI